MYKIQARLKDSLAGNRAMLNYMTLQWDMGMEKLRMKYIRKNKKKEFSGLINALGSIPN